MAQHPGASQIVTRYPDGTEPRWLGTLGHVAGVTYSSTCPGGCDQLSATLQTDARYRTDALYPGRIVEVIRGASLVWYGKLDEPAQTASGWQITAHGCGTFGADYAAMYTGKWGVGTPDIAVNDAISRGMPWVNPGIGNRAGMWMGQRVDWAAQTITDLLNLVCTKGGLTWFVDCRQRGNVLSVFPLPTVPTRMLICTAPVARTLGGFVNFIWIRYNFAFDSAKPADYEVTSVSNPASITMHGQIEAYLDLSSSGVMTAATAQSVGDYILDRYTALTYAGPFTVLPGQLCTPGGTPVDLGAEQAAQVCKLVMIDYAAGGEVTPDPVTFLVGEYSYDDDAQTATITPFLSLGTDFGSLASEAQLVLRVRDSRGKLISVHSRH